MRMILRWCAVLAAAFALTGAAVGQEEAKPREEVERRIVRLQHADPVLVANALAGWADIRPSRELRLLAVHAFPGRMAEVLAAIEELDQPLPENSVQPGIPENFDVTVWLLAAADDEEEEVGDEAPDILSPVIEQLSSSFAHERYRLLETFVFRARANEETVIRGLIGPASSAGPQQSTNYSWNSSIEGFAGRGPNRTVKFKTLRLVLKVPVSLGGGNVSFFDIEINSGIDAPEGAFTVVGTTGVSGALRNVVLVLRARAAD